MKDFLLVDRSATPSRTVLQLHLSINSDGDTDSNKQENFLGGRKLARQDSDSDNSDMSIDDVYTVASVPHGRERYDDDASDKDGVNSNEFDNIAIFKTESEENITGFSPRSMNEEEETADSQFPQRGSPLLDAETLLSPAVEELQAWKRSIADFPRSPSGNVTITCSSPGNSRRWKTASTISLSLSASSMRVRARSQSIVRSDSLDWRGSRIPSGSPSSSASPFPSASPSLPHTTGRSIPIGLDLSPLSSPPASGRRKPRAQSLPDLNSPLDAEDGGEANEPISSSSSKYAWDDF